MDLKLNEFIFKLNRPCVFKNILTKKDGLNSACDWNPEILAKIFKKEVFVFRIGKRSTNNEFQFENECDYVEASMQEYLDWVNGESDNQTKSKRKKNTDEDTTRPCSFAAFNVNEYWAYADYKHMIKLVESENNALKENCIDWSAFGFDKRNATDSTLWIGTKNSFTPCHFDAYGYNLIVQIYGIKRWILFANSDKKFMYPTRVPFEESTIYSKVNIKCPNIEKFSEFKKVQPYIVDLNPGEVLYVPHNWWHYVESLTDSISINTWIDLKVEDDFCRLKEILSKFFMQSVMDSNMINFEKWINSTESYSTQEDNLEIIKLCLNKVRSNKYNNHDLNQNDTTNFEQLVSQHSKFSHFAKKVSFEQFLNNYTLFEKNIFLKSQKHNMDENFEFVAKLANVLTDSEVIELIHKKFLESSTN